jgi:phage terminase small subunit
MAQGTYQACRDANRVEVIAPDSMPQRPVWLTAAGEEVWMDVIGSIAQMKMASEADAAMFGNYCNLQGCIIMAWRKLASGDPEATAPPIVAINRVTKMQEYFGIAGAKSRVLKMDKGGPSGNPFDKFKRVS